MAEQWIHLLHWKGHKSGPQQSPIQSQVLIATGNVSVCQFPLPFPTVAIQNLSAQKTALLASVIDVKTFSQELPLPVSAPTNYCIYTYLPPFLPNHRKTCPVQDQFLKLHSCSLPFSPSETLWPLFSPSTPVSSFPKAMNGHMSVPS